MTEYPKKWLSGCAAMLGVAFATYLVLGFWPHANAAKGDAVYVRAKVPSDITVKLSANWQTTSHQWGCERYNWPGPALPLEKSVPVEQISQTPQWVVWRDAFAPGRCGWMLKSIEVYADNPRSGLNPDRETNIPNRVAYVLSPDDTYEPYSWAMNEDARKPVRLFCNFSQLHELDRRPNAVDVLGVNPCTLGWSKFQGTDAGKREHILTRSQHNIGFTIDNYR